ncbi:helix-turn-helix domain-containing protein [Conexibacter arvalis]|nr:helix-turn-helix transcriptional regulator [Conexibacter arvalis]
MNRPSRSARERLAQAVYEMRTRQRLSQEAVADRADLSRNFVGMVERGEVSPSFDNLAKLADGLGVRLSELMRLYESRKDGTDFE